jgi:membrane-associated protease RseP (regulator of RpoE activity)
VSLSPVAWAGWAGLLVTSLNLIPVGQLDGGHVLYVLFGAEKSRRIFPFILGALMLLGLAWPGWWMWAALVFLMGRTHAEPLDQVTPVDSKRKWLGVLVIFILTFTPIPLSIMLGS